MTWWLISFAAGLVLGYVLGLIVGWMLGRAW